jgi:hypothetical protein
VDNIIAMLTYFLPSNYRDQYGKAIANLYVYFLPQAMIHSTCVTQHEVYYQYMTYPFAHVKPLASKSFRLAVNRTNNNLSISF